MVGLYRTVFCEKNIANSNRAPKNKDKLIMTYCVVLVDFPSWSWRYWVSK